GEQTHADGLALAQAVIRAEPRVDDGPTLDIGRCRVDAGLDVRLERDPVAVATEPRQADTQAPGAQDFEARALLRGLDNLGLDPTGLAGFPGAGHAGRAADVQQLIQ